MALMCGSPAGELPMETGTQGCAEAAQPSCGVRGCGARPSAARGLCVCCVCLSRARNVQQGLPGHGGEVLVRCQHLLPGCKIRHSQLQRS